MPLQRNRMHRIAAAVLVLLITGQAICAAERAPAKKAVLEAPPFRITYPVGDEELAQHSAEMLEHALRSFEDRLPSGSAPIHVYICGSLLEFQQRAKRLGTRPVEGVASSEKGEIIVKAPEVRTDPFDYEGTLRHELVHVLLARNLNSTELPRWLNEGIAMAVGKDFRLQSRFRVARMYVQGRLIPYPELDFAFMAPHTDLEFGDAYAQSLSMTKFLIDRLGEDGFWRMLHGLKEHTFRESLINATGWTPLGFYAAWKQTLWKVAVLSSVVSGFSIFQLGAVLVVAAYWSKRRRNQRILERWAEDEREDDGQVLFARQLEDQEPPYPWEDDEED